jgi:hypothetical protein
MDILYIINLIFNIIDLLLMKIKIKINKSNKMTIKIDKLSTEISRII